MILEQELRELGWQFEVWLCSQFSFSLWFNITSLLCTTTWRQPGLSRGLIDKFQTKTAVFIELLSQLRISKFHRCRWVYPLPCLYPHETGSFDLSTQVPRKAEASTELGKVQNCPNADFCYV